MHPANLSIPRAMQNLKRISGIAALLLVAAAPLAGQDRPEPPIRELLGAYQREMATPPLYRSETGGVILEMITGRQVRLSEARLEALLDGLESIVLNGAVREDTRADAAGLLALAGEGSLPRPRAGTAARLAALYRRSDSELVRRQILSAMPRLEERSAAIGVLAEIVEKPTESFPEESWSALRALLATGEGGTAALRRIHRGGTARNPASRSLVAQYVDSDFRLPRP